MIGKEGGENSNTYVQRVREGTRQYIEELLSENERLRLRIATLDGDKVRLEEQVALLRDELDSHHHQEERLQEQLANIEEENERFNQRYLEVEQHNSNLANLYVASYRLHSTLDRADVLETIKEIVINLIGSEELGIFELAPDRQALELVSFFGIEQERFREVPLGFGHIGKAALTGETYFAHNSSGNCNGSNRGSPEEHLTSCIPLKVDGCVTGAIAIFRLLEQKSSLEEVDYELFHLLATHAATALYCSKTPAELVC